VERLRKAGSGRREVSVGGGGVCAVAAGRSVEELAGAVERAVAGVEGRRKAWRARARKRGGLVEVRFDWVGSGAAVREMCARVRGGICKKEVLVEKEGRSEGNREAKERKARGSAKRGGVELIGTCRRGEAEGEFRGSVREQVELLYEIARAGCEWLDVEIETWRTLGEEERRKLRSVAKVMVSYHDFRTGKIARQNASARGLRRILGELKRSEGDTGKIAVATETLGDAFRVVNLARREKNLVAVPMGEMGTPARILALRQGSALAYAPVEESTAPGQISLEEMEDLYRADQLDRNTRIYGVIGYPIGHSLSPQLHNAAFQLRRMNCVYVPFPVRDLRDFLSVSRELDVAGFSVTLPHKQEIMKYLDECDAAAEKIGAVNTVAVKRGRMKGYNTDYVGVVEALGIRGSVRGKRVLVVGAGGAARAAAFACVDAGAEVLICARRGARSARLAKEASAESVERKELAREKFDVIVNATPVGMQGGLEGSAGESPLEARELNCELVFDLVYRPMRTKLLQMAERQGIATLSGVEMFIAQGAAQWEIWTGERAPVETMRNAVMNVLKGKSGHRD
jgi:3-dehydroquinate dehydratase/shikimate dehydrogenase